MDAFRINVVYPRMAPLAPLGDQRPFLADVGYPVRAVAVDAYRGFEIPLTEHRMMNAFHRLGIFIEVAPPAIL